MPGEAELIGQAAQKIGGITLGTAQTISGLVNAKKTKKEAAILAKTRPTLGRDALADENLALTKSDLAKGMSSKAEAAYNDIADRDFSASLSSILKGGGNLNSIGEIYGSKEEGRQRLAIMKDNLRLSQINNEINASKAVSERNDQQFEYNIDAPWKDKAQANAAARQQAQSQIWNGLQSITGAAMQNGQNSSEKKQFELSSPKNYDDVLGLSGGFAQPVANTRTQAQPLSTTINTRSAYDQYFDNLGYSNDFAGE